MHRHLTRLLAGLAGAAAVSTAALTGTAVAAPATAPGPWDTTSVLQGTVGWTRLGTVAGSPGNAHSGQLLVVSDEPYAGSQVLDWRCPRGVRPPTQLDTSGPCDLLASTSATPVDVDASLTYTGPLAASLGGTWDVAYARWHDGVEGSPTYYQRTVDADVVRAGPLQRTDTHETSDGVETWTTTYTARMQLRGRLPGITLPAGQTPQTSDWTRTTTRTRTVE